jgi:dephospho-CoA kinase
MRRADAFFSQGNWLLTIGLTGGIGSGKSTVTKILAELGAPIIDADKVGHTIYAPDGPAYTDMIAAFGEGILAPDRTIDRRKLGPIVFADPAALKRLNGIVHPKMFARMREMVEAMRAADERKPIVIEAAVLIEANWQPLFDEIWLVTASKEGVIQRVELERGLQPAQTEARIRAQLSDDERRKHATTVITNDGTIADLREKVAKLWNAALAQTGI